MARKIRITDFMDFNYRQIAFDISSVDRSELRRGLDFDCVNHLSRLDDANYIAIWNYDLQDFKTVDDIYFDSDLDRYTLAKLQNDGDWYYQIMDENMKVVPDKMMI